MNRFLTTTLCLLAINLLATDSCYGLLISDQFYVEVDNVVYWSSDPKFDPAVANALSPNSPDFQVGSIVYGSVTYDDANVPATGSYTIRHPWFSWFPLIGTGEMQAWGLEWDGINPNGLVHFGFPGSDVAAADLGFVDGELTQIGYTYNQDLIAGCGAHYESFGGTSFSAESGYVYFDGDHYQNVGYRVQGTIHFVEQKVVPEPSTILLLGSGLLGLVVLNRRRKAVV